MDSELCRTLIRDGLTDLFGSGMARIFTAAPGLVRLMKGEPWTATGLPDVYQLTQERLERLRVGEAAPRVAVV